MNYRNVRVAIGAVVVATFASGVQASMRVHSQPTAASPAATTVEPAPSPLEVLRREAGALASLVKSDSAKAMLQAVANLPTIKTRVIYRDRARGLAISQAEYDKLSASEQGQFTRRECDERFYYTTGYGSPLVYARVIDLAASRFQLKPIGGLKILDFGYGSIGQLRLMASLGAEVHGVEVEPMFSVLYSDPSDTGRIENPAGASNPGSIALHHGQWPANESLVAAVGRGFDLITSKNTLKRGYIHPEREADPKKLVHLGVSDEAFVKAVYDALKPGGLFVIYNISPAQAPADQPYIPWADGRCPFDREMCQNAGFEVLAWDEDDQAAILDWWQALRYDEGKPREEAAKDVFAHFTVLRKTME